MCNLEASVVDVVFEALRGEGRRADRYVERRMAMSSHQTMPGSKLKRCTASASVASLEAKLTSDATGAPSSHRSARLDWGWD